MLKSPVGAACCYDRCIAGRIDHDFPETTGLTIFHNTWSVVSYDPHLYKNFLLFGANRWADFVERMDAAKP